MFENDLLTALFALGAMAAWGSGDFSGGLASKRHNVYSVLLAAQLISAIPLLILVLSFEFVVPRIGDLLLGGLGGVCGMIGLLNLYIGLARGRMSIVAPLAAIISGVIPVLIGILTDGVPTTIQIIGFVIALVAVWFLSSDGRRIEATPVELRFAIISGVGFAVFYVVIDRVSGETALWPVLAARVASLIALSLYTISRREWRSPTRSLLPLIALVGLLDTAGNYFFTMATQAGRLDVATIVSSLYPAITVMLAWVILKECLKLQQWLGVLAALIAIVMIAL
ncbi:MAG: DMT family transporter [Candidatus Parabeggiatoa sp.]|nr:DMT family transporter [Candidatus Parabeggiatoa sp.]